MHKIYLPITDYKGVSFDDVPPYKSVMLTNLDSTKGQLRSEQDTSGLRTKFVEIKKIT